MAEETLNQRRSLRVPARCPVRAEAGQLRWLTETEDLGPVGCSVVAPSPLPAGAGLKLTISSPRVAQVLEAIGRVAWSSRHPPYRLGVAFDRSAHPAGSDWFDRLMAEDPELLAHDAIPDQLPEQAVVYLGRPPSDPASLGPSELEVLRRIGPGSTIRELRLRLDADWDRSRRALLGLLSRGALTTFPADASAPEAWAPTLFAGR